MGELIGYDDLPENILRQIDHVVMIWKKYTAEDLVGVYLHGSIVLNAFCPKSGDIDILIVVNKSLDVATKLAIAKEIIAIDKDPRPLEMSAILKKDAKEWKTLGNCVFHYSDAWTEKYQEKLMDQDAACYVADQEFPDADVTGYIKLIRQSGIVLYGTEIEKVFGDISDADFWSAISADIDDYDFHDYAPGYFASNILILGRILSFKKEKKILSKYDAGLWMMRQVPEHLRYLPELAMKMWFEEEQRELPETDLEQLRIFLIDEIKK